MQVTVDLGDQGEVLIIQQADQVLELPDEGVACTVLSRSQEQRDSNQEEYSLHEYFIFNLYKSISCLPHNFAS